MESDVKKNVERNYIRPFRLKGSDLPMKNEESYIFCEFYHVNTATLFPKIWFSGYSAKRALRGMLFLQSKKPCFADDCYAEMQQDKNRVIFLSWPIPAAVRCKT